MSYNRSNYEEETTVPFVDPVTNEVENRIVPFTRDSSSLRPIYVFDSRDNPFETTRGTRFSLATEYAGGPLGGDSYFVRPEVNFSYFRPVSDFPTRTVAAINVEAGMINAFDEREYPLSPFERFFLGGENSIRGHRSRSLYLREPDGDPIRDPLTNSILGGDKFVQLNLEYHFLLGGPFRVLLFGDAANVFGEDQSIDLSNLRYTAGAELRVLVPVFGAPLRFIYAVNLDEQPGDRFEEFQFSIGTSF
jgi:outer membrane protein insertion porin family